MSTRPAAAFAHHAGLLLRRISSPVPPLSRGLICATTDPAGRGAWDLPSRSYSRHPHPRDQRTDRSHRADRNDSSRPPRRSSDDRDHRRYSDRRNASDRDQGRRTPSWHPSDSRNDQHYPSRREHSRSRDDRWSSNSDPREERRSSGRDPREDRRSSGRDPREERRSPSRNPREESRSSSIRDPREDRRFSTWGPREERRSSGRDSRPEQWLSRRDPRQEQRSSDWQPRQEQWSSRREPRQEQWGSRKDPREDEEPSEVQKALAAVDDDLLYGVNPVLLALQNGRRARFERLYVQEGRRGGPGPGRKAGNDVATEQVLTLAAGLGVPVHRMTKGDLNVLAGQRPHQGLVLQCGKLDYMEMKEMVAVKEGRAQCWLVLDEVSDPQNAGALLRSAYFLGADGVVVCRRNSAALSPVVSKASAGALEVMPVWGVSSMPRFLRAARRDGWRVVGTALEDGTVDAKALDLDCSTLVVMGSEGHGLRPMVRNECDTLVRIRGHGRTLGVAGAETSVEEAVQEGAESAVDSLNVSVAGAVALYQLLGQ